MEFLSNLVRSNVLRISVIPRDQGDLHSNASCKALASKGLLVICLSRSQYFKAVSRILFCRGNQPSLADELCLLA